MVGILQSNSFAQSGIVVERARRKYAMMRFFVRALFEPFIIAASILDVIFLVFQIRETNIGINYG